MDRRVVALSLAIGGALMAPTAALATFPGSNGLIAFTRDGDIYTIDPQTKHEVRVTKDEHVDTKPDWSPDGTKLVFQRDNHVTGEPHVYVMNADGSGVRWIVQGDSPDWSGDGSRIVFGRTTGDGDSDTLHPLFTIRSDGTGEKQLKTRYQDSREPDWSPTNDWIVHQLDGDDSQDYLAAASPSSGLIDWDLPTVNIPHSSGQGVDSEDGSWHPSGNELIYWMGPSMADLCFPGNPIYPGDCDADHKYGLYRMKVDGSGTTLVKKGYLDKSAFSPDGKQVVYSIPEYQPMPATLGLIREDGTDLRLTDGADPDWQAVAPPTPPTGGHTTTVTTTVTQTVTAPGPTRTVPGPTRTVTVTRNVQDAPLPQDRCVIPVGKRYTLTLRATKAIRKGSKFQVRVGKQGQISVLKPGRAGVAIAAVR
jgi:Tol biopolymer transport system component